MEHTRPIEAVLISVSQARISSSASNKWSTAGFLYFGTTDIWVRTIRSLLWVCPAYSRMLSSVSGLDPLDISSISHLPSCDTVSWPGIQSQPQLRATRPGKGFTKFGTYFSECYKCQEYQFLSLVYHLMAWIVLHVN